MFSSEVFDVLFFCCLSTKEAFFAGALHERIQILNDHGIPRIMSIMFGFYFGTRHNRKAHQYGDAQLTSNHDAIFLPLDVSHFGSSLLWDELRSSQQCDTDALTDTSTSTVLTPNLQEGPELHRAMDKCMVCLNDLPIIAFPSERISPQCIHDPSTCLRCLQESIKYDHYNKIWDNIRCPEVGCSSLLSYYDVQKYADRETFIQ